MAYPYIKQEPGLFDDDDDYGYARQPVVRKVRPAFEPRAAVSEGYLAKKSDYIHQSKRFDPSADALLGQCFETTGFIVGVGVVLEISHILIDSGASSSFISLSAARTAGLAIYRSEPRRFLTCNGVVYHSKFVHLNLYISGVNQNLIAFIDESTPGNGHHVLLGDPAMKQFDMRSNHCYGRKRETRWSISPNTTGLRLKRYVLRQDPYHGAASIHAHDYRIGMREAMRPGETAKERHGREVVERAEANLERKRAKYGYSRGNVDDDLVDEYHDDWY